MGHGGSLMASTARTVLEWVKTRLATVVNGAGGYHFDLTPTGRVILARAFVPQRVVGVSIAAGEVVTVHDDVLGKYRRTLTFTVLGAAPSTSTSPNDGALQALNLADDITTGLEGDRTLGGNVYDVICNRVDIEGDEAGHAAGGVCLLTFECWWTANSGVGL